MISDSEYNELKKSYDKIVKLYCNLNLLYDKAEKINIHNNEKIKNLIGNNYKLLDIIDNPTIEILDNLKIVEIEKYLRLKKLKRFDETNNKI